jgi:hypothetical protein
MFRAFAIALAAFIVVGCSTSAEVDNPFGGGGDEQKTQMAAFAAQSQHPNRQAEESQLSALIDRKDGRIKLINPTNQSITDAKVWTNGTFVTRVESIPARGQLTLSRENFYNKDGISLSKSSTPINRVQIETGDRFLNVLGPAYDQ